jgi:hypothetical protein
MQLQYEAEKSKETRSSVQTQFSTELNERLHGALFETAVVRDQARQLHAAR